MGNGTEQTFFQRRHPNGQEVREKMLNITNNQRNSNKNHNGLSPVRITIIKKTGDSVYKAVDKREPSYTVGGNVNWFSHCGRQYGVFKKLKIELPCDPVIPFQVIYPKEMTTVY